MGKGLLNSPVLTEADDLGMAARDLSNVSAEDFMAKAAEAGASTSTATLTMDEDGVVRIENEFSGGSGGSSGSFTPQIVVLVESGSIVTCANGTDTLTGESVDGQCAFNVTAYGAWTVSATLNGQESGTETVTVDMVKQYTVELDYFNADVTVTSSAGAEIVLTDGSHEYTGVCGEDGTFTVTVGFAGTYTATATLNGETVTNEVEVTEDGGAYTVDVSFVKIFGVMWDYANSSTALTRLTKAADPHGHVNVDITTEPVAAVGTGEGGSPFDAYAPWNGMEEYNIIDNVVSYKKGEEGFSRSSYDTMVFIPEFWCRIVDDSTNSKRYFYVADKAVEGFEKHPGSGVFIGRYTTISGYYSKSGAAPLVNITRATARANSRAKGEKWDQLDFAAWCAVGLLYLVEFADWDSQSKVGRGYVDGNSAAISSGGTDSMAYHTGRADGTDGKTAMQYRGIENLWGNVRQWVDGINFSERVAYICLDPANYADDTATNYTAAGVTLPGDGYQKGLGMSEAFPWAHLPDESGGSETTYVPDYLNSSTGWRCLDVGGSWNSGSYAGLFYFLASNTSSYTGTNRGARLLYRPTEAELNQLKGVS